MSCACALHTRGYGHTNETLGLHLRWYGWTFIQILCKECTLRMTYHCSEEFSDAHYNQTSQSWRRVEQHAQKPYAVASISKLSGNIRRRSTYQLGTQFIKLFDHILKLVKLLPMLNLQLLPSAFMMAMALPQRINL